MISTQHGRHLLASCLVLFCLQSKAQQIAESEKQAAIETIANRIAVHYLDIERGGQIASQLQTEYHQGEFGKANDWKEFDQEVTRSLYKYSKDGHLYVRFDPAVVARLKNPQSADETQSNVNGRLSASADGGFQETTILDGNIGYMKVTRIDISKATLPQLQSAMHFVKDTRALIIDLRDNGGGSSPVGPVMESCFLSAGTPLLEYHGRDGSVRTDSAVSWLTDPVYQKPVYIIINKNTASAAEAFAFTLQQNKRARIVGERSAGASYMNDWFVVDDNSYVSVSTAAPFLPGKKTSWEQKGVSPDIRTKNPDPVAQIVGLINKG